MDLSVILDPDRFAPERLRLMGTAELQGWVEKRRELLRFLAPHYPHHREAWTREVEAMEVELQCRTAAARPARPDGGRYTKGRSVYAT